MGWHKERDQVANGTASKIAKSLGFNDVSDTEALFRRETIMSFLQNKGMQARK